MKDMTPYEKWFKMKPRQAPLRVFGCLAYTHIREHEKSKLDRNSRKMTFVGSPLNTKTYQPNCPDTSTFHREKDVKIYEDRFGFESIANDNKNGLQINLHSSSICEVDLRVNKPMLSVVKASNNDLHC